MLDKGKFMEMLWDLTDLAATQGNKLSSEEIREYFSEMELEEEHYNHIYAYLAENRIVISGFEAIIEEKEKQEADDLAEEDSTFLKIYLKELQMLKKVSKEEEQILLREVKSNIPGAKEQLINAWLPKVVKIAKKHKNRGVLLEDLIQEGNIGLLSGAEGLSGLLDTIDLELYMKESIVKAMLFAIEENGSEENLESAVIGRSNLIQEATKYLAEDLGRVATLEELSEYTRLSIDEITDIIKLSMDAVKLGKGELQ